jgi:LDH2 family malate/lactate/ureidoglycolate dehydrogenase
MNPCWWTLPRAPLPLARFSNPRLAERTCPKVWPWALAELKAVKKTPGAETVRVPGERSFAEKEHRLREGVPIEGGVWDQVSELAEELKVVLSA